MGGPSQLKLLLDTHVWVWSQLEPRRLSHAVLRALDKPATERWLSPLSVWEVLLLARKGKLLLEPSATAWVEASLHKSPVREAPLTNEIALASHEIDLSHDDPADRLLAGTARTLELTLVTADVRLLQGRGYRVLKAA